MIQNILVLVGRFLFSIIFLLATPRHFSKEGIQHAISHGVPSASILVPLSGVIAILGAVSIILGFHAKSGAVLLLIFLIPVTFSMHRFWGLTNPDDIHIQISMFAKNISLIGATLMIITFGSGGFSLN